MSADDDDVSISSLISDGNQEENQDEIIDEKKGNYDSDGDTIPPPPEDDDDDDEEEQDEDGEDGDEDGDGDNIELQDLEEKESRHINYAYDEEYQEDDGNESDDSDDSDDENYLQRLDELNKTNLINEYHPELIYHNNNEIELLSKIIYNEKGSIIDPLHKTLPFITKYERARILGERAKQLNMGAKPLIEISPDVIDGYLIALQEYNEKKIPFIIKRPLPNGGCEYWKFKDLEII